MVQQNKIFILLMLSITIVVSITSYLEESTKFNSKEKITECGYIKQLYPERRDGGVNANFFDFAVEHKIIQFYYIHNPGIKKIVNKKEKNNQKIFKTMKVGDRVCITYSLKYYERSWITGGTKTPYIFYIERSFS